MNSPRQMPTVAFALSQEYCDKLDARTTILGINKSAYLRKIVMAILDVPEDDENV